MSLSTKLTYFLFVIFSMTVLGQALDTFYYGSAFGSTLFLNLDFSDEFSVKIEQVLSVLSIILLPTIMFRIFKLTSFFYFTWFFLASFSIYLQHATFGYSYVLIGHSARIIFPLALIYLLYSSNNKKGEMILKLGIALTFIGHGISAINYHPEFLDYIITFSDEFLNYDISYELSKILLLSIGAIDIILALMVFFKPNQVVWGYMAIWGLIVSYWRVIYFAEGGVFAFLVRAPFWGIPLFFILKDYKFNSNFKLKLAIRT
jgi:hypothetical protein